SNRWVGPFYTPIFTPRWVPFSCRSPFDWPVSVQASRLRAANVDAAVRVKLLTPQEGLDELQTALKMWHNNIDAMIQMALILSREQKNSEAKTMLYRVLEIDPTNESANKLLGRNKSP
ncbi:hypothetical protein K2Y11_24995, partial [bacterium]|nr:hypothetical protein [bacterium]